MYFNDVNLMKINASDKEQHFNKINSMKNLKMNMDVNSKKNFILHCVSSLINNVISLFFNAMIKNNYL